MNDNEDIRYRTFPPNDDEEVKDTKSTSNIRDNGETTTHFSDETSQNWDSFEPTSMREDRLDIMDDDDTTPIIRPESEYTGSCGFCCNPQSICHKGIALALMCSVGFGSYFCYDNPGALQVKRILHVKVLKNFSKIVFKQK